MNIVLAETAPNTIIGNIIVVSGAFLILVVLIRVFAWKQITSVFTARAKKISDDIDAAEEAHTEADKLVSQRETELAGTRAEAAGIVETATVTAAKTRQKLLEEAMSEVTGVRSRANVEIEQERKDALESVKADVADISVKIAEKLLGKNLDAGAQSDLIDSYLSKLGE